ncbi:hypothetical protein [Pseudooceanicola spongiae]|jgi:hypothetical protein|uniref:hypothetical protein n=1 Tax=Pseudooceanicola spongiae TaxID=2613965 RepID=UPI001868FDE3|nr:hypothetical protein [Pseudooceanicola spongiae]|tara:strand:- start:372 stop:548 length:177 start_codon:yes stop_codon:yes gene_type:complete
MKAEMNMEAAALNATAIEATHWEPPMAPLDMPRQVLEREARASSIGWLSRFASFLHIA